jgi:sulfur-oxidizing protein SoxZ
MAKTIRVRARRGKDGITEVKLLITHPMAIDQMDEKTGQVKAPGHYIQEVVCRHKNDTVFSCDWGQAVSMNPYLEFHFKGAAVGDPITIGWRDNRGQSDSGEFKIEAQ